MAEEQKTGADLSVKVPGGEVNIKNVKSLNTIATVVTMIMVACFGVVLWFHEAGAQQDKAQVANTLRSSNADIAGALKESNSAVVQALKESNSNTLNAIKDLTAEQRRSTVAMKEIACLNDPAMKNRNDARDFCKRMSRDDR